MPDFVSAIHVVYLNLTTYVQKLERENERLRQQNATLRELVEDYVQGFDLDSLDNKPL